MAVKEEERKYTTFITHEGTFRMKWMGFAWMNAVATFTMGMETSFEGMPFVFIYVDDVLIFSKDEKEHLAHIAAVLERVEKCGIKLKWSKCEWLQKELIYMGRRCSAEGVSIDPEYGRLVDA